MQTTPTSTDETTTAKHTPGPWRLFDGGFPPRWLPDPDPKIVGENGDTVLEFDHTDFYCRGNTPPNDADMALILAAPDLLAACEAVLLETDAGLSLVRAAIAKAKGGAQ